MPTRIALTVTCFQISSTQNARALTRTDRAGLPVYLPSLRNTPRPYLPMTKPDDDVCRMHTASFNRSRPAHMTSTSRLHATPDCVLIATRGIHEHRRIYPVSLGAIREETIWLIFARFHVLPGTKYVISPVASPTCSPLCQNMHREPTRRLSPLPSTYEQFELGRYGGKPKISPLSGVLSRILHYACPRASQVMVPST